ncbi:MAG: hypothetical protein US49_C0006G0075 [candidate division TM6 bacterium GW2011_GWF2_37_49]|nr:MAG: hypothetical protein US49_C0006G0075 [candidate division TM6 bacterium GW2011_GWF2_37_49]
MEQQTDFYEIYDYYSQPMLEKTSVRLALVILGLSLISLMIFLYLKRKKRQITVWEWAFKELALLNPQKCTAKPEYKKFYFQLTGILKAYLNRRFGWHTENKTDDELLGYLQKQNFDSIMLSELSKTLQGASWVKFANEDALKNQAETDLKTVKALVEKTKPSETEK